VTILHDYYTYTSGLSRKGDQQRHVLLNKGDETVQSDNSSHYWKIFCGLKQIPKPVFVLRSPKVIQSLLIISHTRKIKTS
jgi:hypothetical protein